MTLALGSLSAVPDVLLTREMHALVALDQATTAKLIAHLAEFDRRKLYARAGYPSMFAYCVEKLNFSEGAAYVRIEVARATVEFPQLLPALQDGRLHLAAVRLLLPNLTITNVRELIDAATHRSKRELDGLLSEMFPKVGNLQPLEREVETPQLELSPEIDPLQLDPDRVEIEQVQLDPDRVEIREVQLAPDRVEPARNRWRIRPIGNKAISVAGVISQATHDRFCEARSLLRHALPGGDPEQILERALKALLKELASRKFAATARPGPKRRPANVTRRIPAHVRRAVWERDGGRCTYLSPEGHRCEARDFLEFDHVVPVARGGKATVESIRLLCRTHNQLEAERILGRR